MLRVAGKKKGSAHETASDPSQTPSRPRASIGKVVYHLSAKESRVSQSDKVLDQVLRGSSDANIRFAELQGLLSRLGFKERVKGSHHIFWKDGVEEILNLQPKGSNAKPYQVKQVRHVILKHGLGGES
jgi:hypothetical protein